MTMHRGWLKDYKPFEEDTAIKFGNNECLYAKGCGTIEADSIVNGKMFKVTLTNVQYVPEISDNLFSMGVADEKGIVFNVQNGKVNLLLDNEIIVTGQKEEANLYRLNFKITEKHAKFSRAERTLEDWHRALGHPDVAQVKKLSNCVSGFKIVEKTKERNDCGECQRGKGHRCTHPVSGRPRATEVLERVHTDLVGPISPSSIGGAKYFVLIKDEFSSYMNVYFIGSKTQTIHKIKDYLTEASAETHKRVRYIRSDNGTEFKNQAMKLLCASEDIIQEFSAPLTPEQNGEIERANRTVIETARSLLQASGLPLNMWSEAVNTAVYLRNRVTNKRTPQKTPYELFYQRKPDLSHLIVFGQEVHILDTQSGKSKFNAKTKDAYFVGYGHRINTYRCYDPQAKDVIVTSDVVIANHSSATKQQLSKDRPNIPFMIETTLSDDTVVTPNNTEVENDDMNENNIDLPQISEEQARSECTFETTEESGTLGSQILRMFNPIRNLSAISLHAEPTTMKEAMESDDSNRWLAAINEELAAHEENGTWEIVPKPENIKELSVKWIFKIKTHANGQIDRYKARLVARGFTQTEGVDYNDIFAPVVRMDSIRLLFSICVQKGLEFVQFDIATAFLNGHIEEDLYMRPPEGLSVPEGHTLKLVRSLYGLKQAPRCWNLKFDNMLKIFNMKHTQSDPCVYVSNDPEPIYLALYVDDGLIFAKDKRTLSRMIGYLTKHFKVKTVTTSCFIGVEILHNREEDFVFLHQRGYVEKLLSKFNMTDAKGAATPLEVNHTLNHPNTLNGETIDNIPYPEAIGGLLYCALATRPDIAHAVAILSQHCKSPKAEHWQGIKRVLRYLKHTKEYGLRYKRVDNPRLICYTDADWGGDKSDRRSMSGMVTFLTSGPISYKSQKQQSVALSTAEAEYVSASLGAQELIWLKNFLKELKFSCESDINLMCDNQSAIRLIKNPEGHKRAKHIDLRYHFIREKYQEGIFKPIYVPTNNQKADIFTKALSSDKFISLRNSIGCTAIPA